MALQITNCKTYVKDKTGNTQILNNVKKNITSYQKVTKILYICLIIQLNANKRN